MAGALIIDAQVPANQGLSILFYDRATGNFANVATLEAWNDANVSVYDNDGTIQGSGPMWKVPVPALPAGVYGWFAVVKSQGPGANTLTLLDVQNSAPGGIDRGQIEWDGANIIGLAAIKAKTDLIVPPPVIVASVNDGAPTASSFIIAASAAPQRGQTLGFTNGVMLGNSRIVVSYDGVTHLVTVTPAFPQPPANFTALVVFGVPS